MRMPQCKQLHPIATTRKTAATLKTLTDSNNLSHTEPCTMA